MNLFTKRNSYSKKSQIKMMESMMVIVIFMILFVIGIVFFTKYQSSETHFNKIERSLKKSVQLAQMFASLPEVACSTGNVIEENCVDLLKLKAMNDLSKSEMSYYFDIFKFGTVKVHQVYPQPEENQEYSWTIYNKTKKDSGYFSMAIPMVIFDASKDSKYYGLMEVTYYENK